ncbi:MAG: FtsX-like permease family protein, partial [bacterium]
SLMLLFAAGLFFRGAVKAAGLDPGFVPAGDLVTSIDFSLLKRDRAETRRLTLNIAQRARELPGVTAVGVGTMLPYGNSTEARRIASSRATLSNDPKAPDPGVTALYTGIAPGYFEAIGVKILRGRDFTQAECEERNGRRLAIIDEEMAKKLFPNEDAVGQHVRYTIQPKDGSSNDMEVIGVVGTHRHSVLNDAPLARLFVPFAQGYSGSVYLHLRYGKLAGQDRHALAGMIPTVRSFLREIDPDIPILSMAPFADLMEKSADLWIVKLGATLFGAFGLIALLLAVVGVYGVKAYAVACRTREIGIRMALGADRGDVVRMVMREASVLLVGGVIVGLVMAVAAAKTATTLLFGLQPGDPVTLAAAAAGLGMVAMLASYLPALRASRLEPTEALREE